VYRNSLIDLCNCDCRSNAPFCLKWFVKIRVFISGTRYHTVLSFLNFTKCSVISTKGYSPSGKDLWFLNVTLYSNLWTLQAEHYNLQWCPNPNSYITLKMVTANFCNNLGTLHTTTQCHHQTMKTDVSACLRCKINTWSIVSLWTSCYCVPGS
jgi:hypothetical protein